MAGGKLQGLRGWPVVMSEDDALARLVAKRRLILLGEMHGTVETPRFAARLACVAARHGLSVAIGLEHAGEERDLYRDLMGSGGNAAAALERVRRDGRWQRGRDGRYSAAMLALILAAADMRQQGWDVEAVPIGASRADLERVGDYNAVLAEHVLELIGTQRDVVILLTGSAHASSHPAAMGGRVLEKAKASGYDPLLLYVYGEGGSAWSCQGRDPRHMECGMHPIRPPSIQPPLREGQLALIAGRPPYYDGALLFPRLTASPPAVEAADGPIAPFACR